MVIKADIFLESMNSKANLISPVEALPVIAHQVEVLSSKTYLHAYNSGV